MVEPDDIFVGGALAFGGGAPAALERGAVPHREDGVGVVGVDREQHRPAPLSRREPGKTSPAAMRRAPFAVSRATARRRSSRSRNRPNSVVRFSRTRISSPSPAARASQAARIGAKPSSRQRAHQQSNRFDIAAPAAAPAAIRRYPFRPARSPGIRYRSGAMREIDADADHDEIDRVPAADLGFEQDAGELAAGDQNVVRPFAAQIEAGPHSAPSAVAQARAPRQSRAARRCAGGAAGRSMIETIEIARRRGPEAAAAAAPGGLLAGPDQRALGARRRAPGAFASSLVLPIVS